MANPPHALSFPPLASLAAVAAHPDSLPQSLDQLNYASMHDPSQHFASMNAMASTSANPYSGMTATPSAAAPSPDGSATTAKKAAGQKRRSSVGPRGDVDGADGGRAKKPKTSRACDICRRKKIRCDPIPDREPMLCTYCEKHKHDCTWFLPISETRFKKQREKEEADKATASAAAAAVNLPTTASSATLARQAGGPVSEDSPRLTHALAHQPAASSPDSTNVSNAPRKEPRVIGYTSISHLMHSTSTFPTERMIPVDFRYSQQLSVDEKGDGFIRVISAGDAEGPDGSQAAIQGIEHSDAEKLLNYFFTTHAAHFPIVSKADFVGSTRPSPLLFNALCGVSALSHHVAPSILRTIKSTVRSALRAEDMLDNSSLSNIQALLIYAMSMEMEKGTAASKTWNVLRLAISMAQDLGLHRKLGSEKKEQSEAPDDHTELRRRIWGGCLIADRWIAAIYGQPQSINLRDCDTMLPSVFDIRPNHAFDESSRPYLFNSALISLSILLGRVLEAIYSPTGIMLLSEKDAKGLVADLATWQDGLPEELRFQGPENSTSEQGFLHLLYIPVRFLITRPFMRLSFALPERFAGVSVGTQEWSHVEREAREAIEWVDKNESCLEGWFVGTYAFFICSLIQYHSHIRRRDTASLTTLCLARDCLKRLVVPEGECHVRAKIAEVVHLLYHTAVSVSRWAPEASIGLSPASSGTTAVTTLNPTAGVRQRQQDWNMKFQRDGGYFVTDRPGLRDPTGLIRSSASPASSGGPSPLAQTPNSPYSSSLRSTHVEAPGPSTTQEESANGDGAVASPQLPNVPPQPASFPLAPPSLPTPSQPTSSTASIPPTSFDQPPPTTFSTPNSAPSNPPLPPNPSADLSFSFPPDSNLESLSFNPVLNLNPPTPNLNSNSGITGGSASPSGSSSFFGGGGGGGGIGGLGMGMGMGTGMGMGMGLGGDASSFDPFGFSGDGTPAMLPESLFDWGSWQSFAESLGAGAAGLGMGMGMGGQTPASNT